jgi:4-hydroxy-tetrahydrodipicolinate synthase
MAARLDAPLAALHRDLFCESNPIPVKWGVHAMGLAGTGIRLPLTWLSGAGETRVRAAMREAGIPLVI